MYTDTARKIVGGRQCVGTIKEMKGWAEKGHKDLKYESKSFMLDAVKKGKLVERSKEGIIKSYS